MRYESHSPACAMQSGGYKTECTCSVTGGKNLLAKTLAAPPPAGSQVDGEEAVAKLLFEQEMEYRPENAPDLGAWENLDDDIRDHWRGRAREVCRLRSLPLSEGPGGVVAGPGLKERIEAERTMRRRYSDALASEFGDNYESVKAQTGFIAGLNWVLANLPEPAQPAPGGQGAEERPR